MNKSRLSHSLSIRLNTWVRLFKRFQPFTRLFNKQESRDFAQITAKASGVVQLRDETAFGNRWGIGEEEVGLRVSD